MLRLLPICFLLSSCGALKIPARIVHKAGTATVGATKRAASATQKFGKNISDKYFKKKEEKKAGEPTEAPNNKNLADLPEPEPYTPAPVRPTVFIPNQPGTPTTPAPETAAPKTPVAPPLPNNVDLPDLPDLPELPE